jgi:hypothetical protein
MPRQTIRIVRQKIISAYLYPERQIDQARLQLLFYPYSL